MTKLFRTPAFFKWIFHRRIWGFSHSDKVYLTFDDGPTNELTPWIVQTLKEANVKATFFCVGANAKAHPELMQLMLDDGHRVGNHTMRHDRGTKSNRSSYLESIAEASSYISSDLFRPPYGRLPMTFARKIRKSHKVIMWTWLSYDYDHSVSVGEILAQAERIKGGDILVVHDNIKSKERLEELLPALIEVVKKKNLTFELL